MTTLLADPEPSQDVLGRMLTRTDSTGTTAFVWDGMDCVMETDASGNVTRYYVVNGELMSFDRTVSGVVSSYQTHRDALGSIRKVTNSGGSVVATYDTDAWGEQMASTSDSVPNGGLQYRFVGAYGVRWDATSGLYYMRARWYDPAMTRFLSRDTVSSPNKYIYALNQPTNLIDPSGNVPECKEDCQKLADAILKTVNRIDRRIADMETNVGMLPWSGLGLRAKFTIAGHMAWIAADYLTLQEQWNEFMDNCFAMIGLPIPIPVFSTSWNINWDPNDKTRPDVTPFPPPPILSPAPGFNLNIPPPPAWLIAAVGLTAATYLMYLVAIGAIAM